MKNLKLVVNNVSNNTEREIFFVKKELQTILNLYGKMVSNGTWKDYGVSIGPREISFDIYKILKNLKPKSYNERFCIKDKHGNILEKSNDLLNLIEKTRWNNLRAVK
jgi:hypothetical protein